MASSRLRLVLPGRRAAEQAPERYLIEKGDSLYSIADRFGTDVEAIMQLNDLTDPDVIAAGEYLLVP